LKIKKTQLADQKTIEELKNQKTKKKPFLAMPFKEDMDNTFYSD